MAKKKTAAKRKRKRKASAKQIAARAKFARMAKARAKASRKRKRATTRKEPVMARKRKRTTTKRRRSTKRRSGVRLVRRGTSATAVTRRRGRRRGYRRNPGIIREVFGLVKNSGLVLAGGGVGRVVNNMLPSFGNPIADAAKGVLAAYGVHYLGKRFLGADAAGYLAAGAMQVPLKTLIIGFVPQAAGFLGDYTDVGAYSLAAYSDPAGLPPAAEEAQVGSMGSYSGSEMYG